LKIREMIVEDLEFVNYVRNHNSTRFRLENFEKISIESTRKWFLETHPSWKIIEVSDNPVGYLRTSSDTGKTICIGCDIHPDHRRNGYAKMHIRNI